MQISYEQLPQAIISKTLMRAETLISWVSLIYQAVVQTHTSVTTITIATIVSPQCHGDKQHLYDKEWISKALPQSRGPLNSGSLQGGDKAQGQGQMDKILDPGRATERCWPPLQLTLSLDLGNSMQKIKNFQPITYEEKLIKLIPSVFKFWNYFIKTK